MKKKLLGPNLVARRPHLGKIKSREVGSRQFKFKLTECYLKLWIALLTFLYLLSVTTWPLLVGTHQVVPVKKHALLRFGKQEGGFAPPFVEFDLRGDESAAESLRYFLQNCTGNTVKNQSPKYSHLWNGIEFLKDPKCSKFAEHPTILDAARQVMGLDQDAPVYLFGMRKIKKVAGDVHRLHTDVDLATPECRPNHGAILWMATKSECPEKVSPLTFLSGSHGLANTAHDELANRGCWSGPFEMLPCDVNQVIAEVGQQHKDVYPVSGPSLPMTGVLFPSTAWHMTNDMCQREAIVIKFAGSIECARSLQAKFPSSEIGKYDYYPERMPFVRIGPGIPSENEFDPMDYLHMQPSENDDERCYQMKQGFARGPAKNAKTFVDTIYKSGEFISRPGMEHIGRSKRPTNSIFIKSNRFILESMRTFYSTEKQANIAHDPHTEAKLEICAVIKGQMNYAMSGFCDDYFDVLPLKKGQVVVMLPGIYHTASPNAKEDGEHICIKLFPLACDQECDELEEEAPVEASRVVTESLDEDVDEYFKYERSLEIIETDSIDLPGYKKLHVKEVQYRHNEKVGGHKDTHDLVVLTVSGSVTVEAGDATFLLPEHQFVFIPAGVRHGFEASNGPALILFIEVE